jgi:hypothetical protein
MLRLYTDESPGLKVDPVVVLVLSLVFIFSVVALHSEFPFAFVSGFEFWSWGWRGWGLMDCSYCEDYEKVFELDVLRLRLQWRCGYGEYEKGDTGERMQVEIGYGIQKGEKVHKMSAGFLIVGRHLQVECGCLFLYYMQ